MDQKKVEAAKDEIAIVDILKMFRGKLKVMICVVLIATILGAAVGVLLAKADTSYGAEITFYLVPDETTQSLLPILRSEAFAETLLLDENGLPPEEECNPADYAAAIKAIEREKAARANRLRLYRELNLLPYELAPIEEEYHNLTHERSRINDLLKTYMSAQDAIGSEQLDKIAEYEKLLADAEAALEEFKATTYDDAIARKLKLEEENFLAKRELADARKDADEAVEKVVAVWRENEEIRSLVATIQRCVTYKYATKVDSSDAAQSVESQNTSFLVISVSVPQDKEMAAKIITMIKERTPEFVEKELERLTGAAEASCTLTSTFAEAKEISGTSLVKNVILYGLIGLAGGLVVTSAVIITKGFLPEDLFEKKEKKTKKNKKDAEAAQ